MRRGFLALVGLALACCALAPAAAFAQGAGKRVALVVGNSDYRHIPGLKHADDDAGDVAAALERSGFEVARLVNADLDALRTAVATFQRSAAGADAAVVFYSGHALRFRGDAYLVPVTATLKDDTSYEWDNLQLTQVIDALGRARASFLLIEGCGAGRLVNALTRRDGVVIPGVGDVTPRGNMMVATSTAATGEDCDAPPRNALFTGTLLAEIDRPGINAARLFQRVRDLVAHRGGGRQSVEIATNLPADAALARADTAGATFRRLGADPAAGVLRAYVERFGDHPLTGVVRTMITQREQAAGTANPQADPWRGQIDDRWNRERLEKAQAARQSALEARWSREQADRQAELAAIERRRLEQERLERERLEREEQARIARAQEEERRRLERERLERERLEREEQARVARAQEEERKRQADLAAAERRRQEQERVARENAEREERERTARAQEEERKRQADLAVAERRRQEQEKVDREKAERDERARLVREQEEQRRRQAELAQAERRRQEQEKADRERTEREERVRAMREQEEQRRRLADAEAQRRLAPATPPVTPDPTPAAPAVTPPLALTLTSPPVAPTIVTPPPTAPTIAPPPAAPTIASPSPVAPSPTVRVIPTDPQPVPVGGQAVDEASRFTAEQRRLALERIERERRGRPGDPEFATPLPSEGQPATPAPSPNTQLAALPPATPAVTSPAVPAKTDTPELIKSAQEELKRLGCYAGLVHGRMNNGTKTALENAAKRLGSGFAAQPVSEDAVRQLRERQAALCVAARPAAREEEDERPARRPSIRREAPEPRVARPSQPSQPRSSGGCFTFNGRQFCQ